MRARTKELTRYILRIKKKNVHILFADGVTEINFAYKIDFREMEYKRKG